MLLVFGSETEDGIAIQRILHGEDYAGGSANARDFFDHDGVAGVIHARAAIVFGNGDAGEAEFRSFAEGFARKATGLVNFFRVRLYFRFGKLPHALPQQLLLFGQFQIHAAAFGDNFASSENPNSRLRGGNKETKFRPRRPMVADVLGERLAQFFVGGGEFFGLDAGFGDDGHEIRVALPARQYVQVQVAGDAGASGPAQVHAQIVSLGMVNFLKRGMNALGDAHHFGEHLGIGGGKIGDMRIGNDHDVSGGVGITIQDEKAFRAAQNDQGFGVIAGGDGGAEDAAFVLRRVGDIAEPPGRPQIIHSA